jgi:hypothetical protein
MLDVIARINVSPQKINFGSDTASRIAPMHAAPSLAMLEMIQWELRSLQNSIPLA